MVIFRYEFREASYEKHKSGFASRFSLLVTLPLRTLKTTFNSLLPIEQDPVGQLILQRYTTTRYTRKRVVSPATCTWEKASSSHWA